ncbi:MAG: hypothetical protein ACXVJB_02800 [Mucilaginibacter sp.]
MKSLKISMVALIMLMVAFSINTIAQTSSEKTIPQTIINSFNAKYPGVSVKNWKSSGDKYVAKAVISNHKSFVTFGNNGAWINTTTRISWPWKLPKNIKESYGKSKYHSWHLYSVMRIEKPVGESFGLMVDNGNLQIDATHQSVLPNEKLLEFSSDGILTQVIDVSGDAVTYTTVLKLDI